MAVEDEKPQGLWPKVCVSPAAWIEPNWRGSRGEGEGKEKGERRGMPTVE